MICSAVEEDVVRGEQLRPLAPTEDLLNSMRSSVVSNASVADMKRDQHGHGGGMLPSAATTQPSSHSSTSTPSERASTHHHRSKRTRFENKLKLIAQYIKTMSAGLSHKHRAPPAAVNNAHSQMDRGQLAKKRSQQMNLSQHSVPRSAPDVLHMNKSQRNILSNNNTASTMRVSNASHQSLTWDEIIAGAVLVEENEIMPASPRSRKRGRPSKDLFEDAELRRICKVCDVPEENIDEVMKMVSTQFGTCHLDLTVLHELVGGNSVVFVGMVVFSCIDCGAELLDLHRLPAFLQHIQERYDPKNPFHNACHAADVLHSLFIMLWTTKLGDRVATHNQIGVLFAAVMHDIGHNGLTNDFLLKTNHEIATKYATPAPMEEMHLAVALDLLADTKFNVLSKLCNDQLEQVTSIVRETIRSTALCYQKDMLRDVAAVPAKEWEATSGVLPLKLQTVALRCAMHVSDISQTMKPYAIHSKWVARLNEEQFLQGDLDAKMRLSVCPEVCYRDKWNEDSFLASQVWFLENLALPAAKGFNSIPWLDAPMLETNLMANIAAWQAKRFSSS